LDAYYNLKMSNDSGTVGKVTRVKSSYSSIAAIGCSCLGYYLNELIGIASEGSTAYSPCLDKTGSVAPFAIDNFGADLPTS
jgi:hypothetical protein